MERFIEDHFIPVKIHVKEQGALFPRYGAVWTPTLIVLDSHGEERYRFEGFLPADEFLAHLELGVARVDFAFGRFDQAEKRYQEIVERYPDSETAPEALYWAGVSRYKGTHDGAALVETARQFQHRYPDSSWAKRASAWAA